jgi:hypothetical protein
MAKQSKRIKPNAPSMIKQQDMPPQQVIGSAQQP